jgi:uncharacterized Tic20 family protein
MSEQPPTPPGSPQQPPPPGGEPGAPTPPPTPPPSSTPPSSTPPSPPPPPGGHQAPPPGGYQAPPPGGYQAPPPGAEQQSYGYGGPAGYPPSQLNPQDERTWGMLAHISALLAAVVGLSFLGPLLVLLIQGPKSQFVRRQSVEALNFQITTYIAFLVSVILIFVLIGIILIIVVFFGWLILTIVAGVAANRGEDYRYPFNIRLVK